MKIIVGADHGGFELKEEIKRWLLDGKHEVVDVGAVGLDPEDDYVDYATLVAEEVAGNDEVRSASAQGSGETRGILFCRNGYGMMMAANRFRGVRCGEAFDVEAVRRGRTDDDINCLSIPSDYIKDGDVKEMVKVFLETKFSDEERYKRRLWKLESLSCGDTRDLRSASSCCGGGGCGNC